MLASIMLHPLLRCSLCNVSKWMLPIRTFKYIPPHPITIKRPKFEEPVVSEEDIILLERLSLVDFGNKQAVERLTEAIKFADSIRDVCTEGVEPLYTVQEDRSLELRPDVEEETPSVDEVISCAAVTEDDYFVAPPGNVPLEVVNTYRDDATPEGATETR